MFIDTEQIYNDLNTYIYWFKNRITGLGYLITLYFIIVTILNLFASIFLKNSLFLTLILGSINTFLLGLAIIPIPWISEGTNIKNLKNLDDEKSRILFRTRLIEQIFVVELYQFLLFIFVIINNLIFPTVDSLFLRLIIFFAILSIFDIFIIILGNFFIILSGNYLRFLYSDIIPTKRPMDSSARDFRGLRRLKFPWDKGFLSIELDLFLGVVFYLIYLIPLIAFCLYYGNFPKPPPGVQVDKFTQVFQYFIIHYMIYWTIVLNLLFIIVIVLIWIKLPVSLHKMNEKNYSIPSKFYEKLIRISDPKYHEVIKELSPEQNKIEH